MKKIFYRSPLWAKIIGSITILYAIAEIIISFCVKRRRDIAWIDHWATKGLYLLTAFIILLVVFKYLYGITKNENIKKIYADMSKAHSFMALGALALGISHSVHFLIFTKANALTPVMYNSGIILLIATILVSFNGIYYDFNRTKSPRLWHILISVFYIVFFWKHISSVLGH